MSLIKFQGLKRKEWPRSKKATKIEKGKLIFKIIYTKEPCLKVGFVIPKKVAKKAVLRNKIKRRLREIMREEARKIKRGGKVLIFALPGVSENFFVLRETVRELISKTQFYHFPDHDF